MRVHRSPKYCWRFVGELIPSQQVAGLYGFGVSALEFEKLAVPRDESLVIRRVLLGRRQRLEFRERCFARSDRRR